MSCVESSSRLNWHRVCIWGVVYSGYEIRFTMRLYSWASRQTYCTDGEAETAVSYWGVVSLGSHMDVLYGEILEDNFWGVFIQGFLYKQAFSQNQVINWTAPHIMRVCLCCIDFWLVSSSNTPEGPCTSAAGITYWVDLSCPLSFFTWPQSHPSPIRNLVWDLWWNDWSSQDMNKSQLFTIL